ncbi:MAG: DUF72 domain-containing protein [Actinomycetota bacterium]
MPVHIGTSGWQYRHWHKMFYPEDLASARWLEHYSARFATVEINNTFYGLPHAKTFEHWAERTPDDFVFALKMSRYLTHVKRLQEPAQPVALFLERARLLGSKLGPVLLQLPPSLAINPGALEAALAPLCSAVRVAVEFRHDSWNTDQIHQILADHGATWCLADSRSRPTVWRRTADWAFVRFHDGAGWPSPCYTEDQLHGWAQRLAAEWGPEAIIFAYFNNDGRGCAPRDAVTFARVCWDAGLHPTRVPDPGETHVEWA